MRLIRAKLKGFKGIKRGMGLDTLDIDFTKLPAGLIAFVGPNGKGKTTTLDNLHPFRVFPSRTGSSFYDLCEGPDAQKELVFEHGVVYRSVIHVDVDRKKQEAYLYRQDGSEWLSINKDGKTTSYDAAIESVMGSEKLFFLSVFRAQNSKPLSAHTKGELKEIFEDLLGLDEIREKGEKAKEVKKHLLSVRDRLKGEIDGLSGIIKEKENKEKRFGTISGEMSSLDNECKLKEKESAETDSRIAGISAGIVKNEAAQAAIARLKQEAARNDTKKQALFASRKTREAEYGKKIDEKTKKLERVRKIADNGHVIREKVEEEKGLSAALDELKRSLTSLDEKERALSSKFVENGKKLDALNIARKYAIEKAEKDMERAKAEALKLEGVPCLESPMSAACKFIKDAVQAKDSLKSLEEALASAKAENPEITGLAEEIAVLNAELTGIRAEMGLKKKETQALEENIAGIKKYTVLLSELETAESVLTELNNELAGLTDEKSQVLREVEKEIEEMGKTILSLHKEISIAELSVDASLSATLISAQKEKAQKAKELNELRDSLSRLHAEYGAIEESLKNIRIADGRMKSLAEKTAAIDTDITEWAILEKALGRDGVIALEIDDAGPAISGIANELLVCFGSKFAVKIETTRLKKDGSGDIIEVFDIRVIDTEQNEGKSLLDMSGGEKVWIEDAVTKAIGLYNKQQAGREALTLFTDEKDGALDAQKKKEYLLMKRRTLELGGYEREFFITHSTELQEMADARIVFEDGGVRYET